MSSNEDDMVVANDEPRPPPALRCDLARGMERTRADAIHLNAEMDAPLFVIPFELDDPTSLPRLTVEAIWVLNHIGCSLEKAEQGMYIHGLPGFVVDRQEGKKDILRRVEEDGLNAPVIEMQTQVRVYEVHASHDDTIRERYALLVVRSPLAFSLRQAANLTIKPTGRRMLIDSKGVDERRRVWARLVMHVRSGVPPYHGNAELLRMFEGTMDWMRAGDADGFTCLFSAQMAMDWIRMHFRSKHAGARHQLIVPGLEEPLDLSGLDGGLVTPAFVEQCRRYDLDVDRETSISASEPPPAAASKRKRVRRGRRGEEAEPTNDEEQAVVPADVHQAKVQACDGLFLESEGTRDVGLPPCVVAIEIVAPTHMEGQKALVEFQRHMCTFPESVMLELLRGRLQLPAHLMDQMAERIRNQEGVHLNITEMRDVVMGGVEQGTERQMLCMGDAVWGEQMKSMVAEVEGAGLRFNMMRDFVRMGFALAYTRATGSDGYTNGRVASYGRFMTHEDGDSSRRACRTLFDNTQRAFQDHGVEGSVMHRAWGYAMETILACDRAVWNLRPDNLFLFLQILVSDVMLCLNFHGSVIDGAFNGIGATLVVRDGGGSYNKRFKERDSNLRVDGQVMDKDNSVGADNTNNAYKQVVDIGEYEKRFRTEGEIFTEMKRVTETSLMKETCNIYEGLGSHLTLKHAITETMGRKYSTELKAGGDQQSESCMTAIAWLISRNTTASTAAVFSTTREDEHTKQRIRVEYRQVVEGYLMICSNNVRCGSRERFGTMLAVARSVCSASSGMSVEQKLAEEAGQKESEARRAAQDGSVDRIMQSSNASLRGMGRDIFFTAMGTAVYAGFMQWTGMLGQIHETSTTRALLGVFMAHFELCKDLLNPDMASQKNRMRFLQVSKARGVAMALFGLSVRETIEAGRLQEPQQMAVERTCMALKAEGASVAVPWIMADVMEHMMRLDFFIVMEMLAELLKVPFVELDALLEWLDTGSPAASPEADRFFRMHAEAGADRDAEEQGLGFMKPCVTDVSGRDLTPVEHCLYITHPLSLRVTRLDTPFTPDVRTQFCERVAKRLRDEFKTPLREHCQVKDSEQGDEIVRAMLERNMDKGFAWPSVLLMGQEGGPRSFWMGREPPDAALRGLKLAPIRMILVESTVAKLGVDIRWLLLVNSLSEGRMCQSSRFSIAAQLVQRLYQHCIPMPMVSARELFTGLPTQWTGEGVIWPPVLASRRKTLRRPGRAVGMDAPCATGMVEDLGVAAPRYELAKLLGVSERDLPSDCVHYEFPHDIWTPALVGDANRPGGVLWRDGRMYCMHDDGAQEDITAPSIHDDACVLYLSGRVTRPIRPLCHFYRPGVLVRAGDGHWGRVGEFEPSRGRYPIAMSGGIRTLFWTPYEVEDNVIRPDASVRFHATALPLGTRLQRATDGAEDEAKRGMIAEGLLEYLYVEDVTDGCIMLRMRRGKRGGAHSTVRMFGTLRGSKARNECEVARFAPHFMVPVTSIVDVGAASATYAAWTHVCV